MHTYTSKYLANASGNCCVRTFSPPPSPFMLQHRVWLLCEYMCECVCVWEKVHAHDLVVVCVSVWLFSICNGDTTHTYMHVYVMHVCWYTYMQHFAQVHTFPIHTSFVVYCHVLRIGHVLHIVWIHVCNIRSRTQKWIMMLNVFDLMAKPHRHSRRTTRRQTLWMCIRNLTWEPGIISNRLERLLILI